jgi:hypothetical protein
MNQKEYQAMNFINQAIRLMDRQELTAPMLAQCIEDSLYRIGIAPMRSAQDVILEAAEILVCGNSSRKQEAERIIEELELQGAFATHDGSFYDMFGLRHD